MVVAGLPERRKDHAEAIANFALDMLNEAAHVRKSKRVWMWMWMWV